MSANPAQIERLAIPYALALIEVAQEKKLLDKLSKDIQDLKAMLSESDDLVAFTKSPLISAQSKKATLVKLSKKAKLQDITTNFLMILVQNSRLGYLNYFLSTVEKQIDRMNGKLTAQVTSASALSADQTKNLKASLEKALSSDVSLETDVNEEILGGLIIKVGSQMIDDSIKTKLDRMSRNLSNTTGFKTQIKQEA